MRGLGYALVPQWKRSSETGAVRSCASQRFFLRSRAHRHSVHLIATLRFDKIAPTYLTATRQTAFVAVSNPIQYK